MPFYAVVYMLHEKTFLKITLVISQLFTNVFQLFIYNLRSVFTEIVQIFKMKLWHGVAHWLEQRDVKLSLVCEVI